jgi:hypothetical protein
MGHDCPPLEHLVTSSNITLESFELSRLNRVSNLRKEVRQILDEWIEAEVAGRIARWILDCRRSENPDGCQSEASIASRACLLQLEMAFPPLPSAELPHKYLSGQHPPQAALEACPQNDSQTETLARTAVSLVFPDPITTGPCAESDAVRRVLQAVENLADNTATTLPRGAESDGVRDTIEINPQLLGFRILHGAPSATASGIRRRRPIPGGRLHHSCAKSDRFARTG